MNWSRITAAQSIPRRQTDEDVTIVSTGCTRSRCINSGISCCEFGVELVAVPAFGYVGGIIVATYVFAITFLAPRIGAGNTICYIVTGQIIAAVAIDHFVWFGLTVFHLNWHRVYRKPMHREWCVYGSKHLSYAHCTEYGSR